MIDSLALLTALRTQVRAVEADVRRWDEAGPMAADGGPHSDPAGLEVTLAAVAWVMATVFVRFCEDNQLTDAPYIAGPGERLSLARDRQMAYFQRHPALTDREWIVAALESLGTSAATTRMFDLLHRLMARHPISHDAASRLLDFWRQLDPAGRLLFDFTDEHLDTRFLADLYQDLSETARKTYSLLQTPEFIAEFLLARTLEPAITEFGLEPTPAPGHNDLPCGVRFLDDACGSGTMLLGGFYRLLSAWEHEQPGVDRGILVAKVLESLHGVDKHPVAVVICRFRLLMAAMRAAGWRRIAEVPRLQIAVAAGDSLIPPGEAGVFSDNGDNRLASDVNAFSGPGIGLLRRGSYHVVVANPPYITVKDAAESVAYRHLYAACHGMYSLVVPFTVRSFQLARHDDQAGYVGMLLANSFMKREFGRPLVEDFLTRVDLTHVVDTSGAFIPGHGTPTLILAGRARFPHQQTVRAALGIRGEPSAPYDSAHGMVWQAIVNQLGQPGSTSEWVSVTDIDREYFAKHPWNLSGIGVASINLLDRMKAGGRTLADCTEHIGIFGITGADDALTAPSHVFRRQGLEAEASIPVFTGSDVRDWGIDTQNCAFYHRPGARAVPEITHSPRHYQRLWPVRTTLRARQRFGMTLDPWYSWHQVSAVAEARGESIVSSRIASHPHFAVRRDRSAPLQSALVTTLPRTSPPTDLPGSRPVPDLLGLEGLLNSSVTCYWLKYYSPAKGAPSADQLRADEPWAYIYEFGGTHLEKLPVPERLPTALGAELDELAGLLGGLLPGSADDQRVPTREGLVRARTEWECMHGKMIALQEELDWDVYHAYGLITDEEAAQLIADPAIVPAIELGERAFEIVLGRRMLEEGFRTEWFTRHRSTPITEIPAHWPDEYKAVVERRIAVIQANKDIGLIERPEYKRRWLTDPWEVKEAASLSSWLLDRCEDRSLWFGADGQPQPMTVNRLADRLRQGADVVSVARLLRDDPNADLAKVLAEIIADEHVPYLAQFRYRPEGMRKRSQWEQTWDLQREEDATGKRITIVPPPKYANSDFQKPSYWRNRGKLDMPNERFISYPDASPDSDGSLLLGWAGWDHQEQAQALYWLIEERQTVDGWGRTRLTPLLAGLSELMPWVRQWHSGADPGSGGSIADALESYLSAQLETLGLTGQSLDSWTAPPVRRGRPSKKRPSGVRSTRTDRW